MGKLPEIPKHKDITSFRVLGHKVLSEGWSMGYFTWFLKFIMLLITDLSSLHLGWWQIMFWSADVRRNWRFSIESIICKTQRKVCVRFSYDNCANTEYALGLFTDERKLLRLLARIFLHTMSCGLKSREKSQRISCTCASSTKGHLRYLTTVSAFSSASIVVVCNCLFRASSLLRINQKEKMLRFILVCVVDLVSQALLYIREWFVKAHIPFQLVFGDPLLNLYSHLISVCNFLKRHVRLVTSGFATKRGSITSLNTSFGATGLSWILICVRA